MIDDCGWPVADVSGACRNRLIHPNVYECGRCAGKRSDVVPQPPQRTAKRAEWADWAVSCGAARDYADSRSRPELIDEFGTRLPTSTTERTD